VTAVTSLFYDESTVFRSGLYTDDDVEDVADEDPEYLRSLLAREEPVSPEDQAVIRAALGEDDEEGGEEE